jgi:hypothetical protein
MFPVPERATPASGHAVIALTALLAFCTAVALVAAVIFAASVAAVADTNPAAP